MSRRPLCSLILAAGALALDAQGVFDNANSPNDPICPRIMLEKTQIQHMSQYGRNSANASGVRYTQKGDWFIPQDERKDVSAFTAYDEKAKGIPISSMKNKVVLVGLWSKNCDPSAKMLMEFASLYPKGAQYGFEILAINFDENQQDGGGIEGGWRAINKFMNRNRQFFEVSKMPVFTPGLGKEGPSNFMDMVYSLPVLCVVDRQGKLAEVHIGYKDGFVGEAVKRALKERPPSAEPAMPPQAAVQ
jgi:thiol-disulfide isomerase/thioredoxin